MEIQQQEAVYDYEEVVMVSPAVCTQQDAVLHREMLNRARCKEHTNALAATSNQLGSADDRGSTSTTSRDNNYTPPPTACPQPEPTSLVPVHIMAQRRSVAYQQLNTTQLLRSAANNGMTFCLLRRFLANRRYSVGVCRRPRLVIAACVVATLACSLGLFRVQIITNPDLIWVSNSPSLLQ